MASFANSFTEEDIRRWQKIYGSIEVTREIWKMTEWVLANPSRSKKNYKRFIVNWLSKAQREAEAIETRELVRDTIQRQKSSVGKFDGKGGLWIDGVKIV